MGDGGESRKECDSHSKYGNQSTRRASYQPMSLVRPGWWCASALSRLNPLRNRRGKEGNHPFAQAKSEPTSVPVDIDFRAAFCERYRCSMEDFDRRVFWKCLYRHALPLAAFLCWTNREFFQPDIDLIHSLASTTTFSEVRAEASFIRHDQRMQSGFLRGTLRIRISGRRLAALACRTLSA
jgi:hypothetical protein